jgi:hypothetical protein
MNKVLWFFSVPSHLTVAPDTEGRTWQEICKGTR